MRRPLDLEWYAYLATAVAPADLARGMTARVKRLVQGGAKAARQRLRPGVSFAASPSSSLWTLRGPRPSLLETTRAARERTRRLLLERWPRECESILAEAAAARSGRLPIFAEWVDCARTDVPSPDAAALDFDRDPLAPHIRWDPREPGPKVDLFRPGADAKAAWEVGRLSHLWRFAQARWLAADDAERSAWARAFLAAVRQFRADCPAGMGVQWSCSMEVSARAINVALAFALVEDDAAVTPEAVREIEELLSEHGRFIECHLEDTGPVRNNHYAADLAGLVIAGCLFPALPESPRWRSRAARALWDEIGREVRSDGTQFESSTGYQRLCAEMFLAALLSARAAGLGVPRETAARIAALFRSAGEMAKPSGRMPQLGDLDSCRLLPLVPRAALDASYLPALGAAALRDPALKAETDPCPAEVAWLLGAAGVARYDALPSLAFRGSVLLRDAGVAVLREAEGYLFLCAGPNGQGGCGGHAHNDKNGIEISWGSQDLVVDRGTLVYARDPGERNVRRGTAAHSTAQVDGEEQNPIFPGRLFALPDLARARIVRLERRDGLDRAIGEHRGYERLPREVLHRRSAALLARERAFLVEDELVGKGSHRVEIRYHVPHEEAALREASPAECARLQALQGRAAGHWETSRSVEIREAGSPLALFVFRGALSLELAIEKTDVSPGYGERLAARTLTLRAEGELPAVFSTAILVLS